jgi:hypothetical protein
VTWWSVCCAAQIRINFNITLLDLPCRYAVVDVLDVLGTNRMNVSRNIEKVRRQPAAWAPHHTNPTHTLTCRDMPWWVFVCLRTCGVQWSLDQDGRRRFFQGRNREERDIEHDEHHPELQVAQHTTL